MTEPEAVALHTSRGYETPRSKTLMRWTAVFADITCKGYLRPICKVGLMLCSQLQHRRWLSAVRPP